MERRAMELGASSPLRAKSPSLPHKTSAPERMEEAELPSLLLDTRLRISNPGAYAELQLEAHDADYLRNHLLKVERCLRNESTEDVPESSYGAAMAMLVQAHAAKDWNVHAIALIVYCVALLSIFAEFFILMTVRKYLTAPAVVRVRDLYGQYHADVFQDGYFLRYTFADWDRRGEICELPLANKEFCFAILAIWTGFVMIDVKETLWLGYLWAWLRKPATQTEVDELADWNEDVQKYVIRRAPLRLKAVVFATILVPKLLIAVFCWWLGSRWLIATPSYSDLILNSVALAFVIEIDEMVFHCMIPKDTQEWVLLHCLHRPARVPDYETPANGDSPTGGCTTRALALRNTRVQSSMVVMALTVCLVLTIPAVYMKFQQAIPNYAWDVHDHCEAYWEEIADSLLAGPGPAPQPS